MSNLVQEQKATSDPIQDFLNAIIKSLLPKINSEIQSAIKSNHLDPWGQVAHGSDTLGSINLGICHASVRASYNVGNMKGLSSFDIKSLQISSAHQDGNNPGKLVGTVTMSGALGSNLSAHVGGGVEAKCGFIHKSVGLGGTATVKGTTVNATGSFTASIDGNKVCLNSVIISNASIDYGNVDVSIDGLGIFNSFLSPLIDVIVGLFKGQIRGAISSALTPLINKEVSSVIPQCKNL